MTDKEFDYMFLPIKADKDIVREIEEIQSYLTDKVAESEQAVKEFAEKLKEKYEELKQHYICIYDWQGRSAIYGCGIKIDELLKEFIKN